MKKYCFDERVFERCDTPQKAYWLGFIMADGYVIQRGRQKQVGFLLAHKDSDHLEKFRDAFSFPQPIRKRRNHQYNKDMISLVICSRAMTEDLAKYGIVPRKTGHEQIMNIPDEFVRDFVRGYFDGDGSIMRDGHKKKFVIVSASCQFLETMQGILMENCNLSKTKIYYKSNAIGGCYAMQYGGVYNIERICDYLYDDADIYLDRKRVIFNA